MYACMLEIKLNSKFISISQGYCTFITRMLYHFLVVSSTYLVRIICANTVCVLARCGDIFKWQFAKSIIKYSFSLSNE